MTGRAGESRNDDGPGEAFWNPATGALPLGDEILPVWLFSIVAILARPSWVPFSQAQWRKSRRLRQPGMKCTRFVLRLQPRRRVAPMEKTTAVVPEEQHFIL